MLLNYVYCCYGLEIIMCITVAVLKKHLNDQRQTDEHDTALIIGKLESQSQSYV